MNPHWTATPEEVAAYNKSMAKNRLWRLIDCTQDEEGDDDFDTHARRESLTKEELL